MRQVKTQKALDAAIKKGEIVRVKSGLYCISGNARVYAYGNARVDASGNARVDASGNARVDASGNASVYASGNASVYASGYSAAVRRSAQAECRGNVLDLTTRPETVEQWLARYHVAFHDGLPLLYKATHANYATQNGVSYVPGTDVVAPDWEDRSDIECGSGLHFCWCAAACRQFNREPAHFIACQVAIEDIRIYDGQPQWPDKIRARACRALYECDEDGNRVAKEEGAGQ